MRSADTQAVLAATLISLRDSREQAQAAVDLTAAPFSCLPALRRLR